MRPDDATDWLRLHHAPGIAYAAVVKLLNVFGSAKAICAADAEQLQGAGLNTEVLKRLRSADERALARDLDWLEKHNHHLLVYNHKHYPQLLREIPDPPIVLYAIGNVTNLNHPQIAVVGSRRPTPGGERNATKLVTVLAESGLTITSGLARGIDAAAHWAAINAGGTTIAVTGTGLDIVYPVQHRVLAHRIAENGTLLSEFPCGVPPLKTNFPRRNRLMSGMSLGTLVIEAEERSGTLITARLAGEQGREVFAVPGSIVNPTTAGCHKLIQEGAKLVQSAQDVLDEIPISHVNTGTDAPQVAAKQTNGRHDQIPLNIQYPTLNQAQRNLLQLITPDEGIFIDALVETSGLEVSEVSSLLLSLELNGCVTYKDGLYIRTQ